MPYVEGTSARNDCDTPLPMRQSFYCSCLCHQINFSIHPPVCWCKCDQNVTRRTQEMPVRSFVEDCLKEIEQKHATDLREMEDRIKTHITKIKHEIIQEVKKNNPPKVKLKKEVKNDIANRTTKNND